MNDYVISTLSGTYDNLAVNDWSVRFFVYPTSTSNLNMQVYDSNNLSTAGSGNTNNRFFITYQQAFNRVLVRLRTNATNFNVSYPLHDNNSATGTGTNSSVRWNANNRGNVNSDSFNMWTVTYDASQSTASNAFKFYWNQNQCTVTTAVSSGTRTNNTIPYQVLGTALHNTTAANTPARYDEYAFYSKTLSSAEVTTLWNSGGRATAAQQLVTSNLQGNLSFDDGTPLIYGSGFTASSIIGGTTTNY